jgi:HAD superfamily hydrolase (TIGR01549 family)
MVQSNTLEQDRSVRREDKPVEKRAVIFDLYGTLIDLETHSLLRKLSRFLGVRITNEMLRQSLTQHFPDERSALKGFVEIILGREATEEEIAQTKPLLDEHLAKAKLVEGVKPLLTFLRRRGIKLALLSNVAQIFKKPFYDLGLDQYFDVIHWSSDTGLRKPEGDSYLGVCRDLGVAPQECLFFGDDAKNDYDGPLYLHMRPVHIGNAPRAETVSQFSDLLWLSLSAEPLLRIGQRVQTDRSVFTVSRIEPLNESDLGMYNIVARVYGHDETGAPEVWYAKRFLDPSSVYVELTAHELVTLLGVSVPRAFITEASEPILFTSPAEGALWQDVDCDETIAEEVGAHCAAAYIVSNADWRPRNTLVCKKAGVMTAIDLEHCLFDRVLALSSSVMDVNDPKAIDALDIQTPLFTRSRVLSPGAVRRARRCFTRTENRNSEEIRLFLKGWERTFEIAASKKQAIADIIRERMDAGQLIVGTKSHRRAFASIDLHDLLERIDLGRQIMFNDEMWRE